MSYDGPVETLLAVVVGGGEKSSQIEAGEERVVDFIQERNQDRKDRLRQSGFSEDIAEANPDLHVRTSGGLM